MKKKEAFFPGLDRIHEDLFSAEEREKLRMYNDLKREYLKAHSLAELPRTVMHQFMKQTGLLYLKKD